MTTKKTDHSRSGRPTVANLDKRMALLEEELKHYVTKQDLTSTEASLNIRLNEMRQEMEENWAKQDEARRAEHAEVREDVTKLRHDVDVINEKLSSGLRILAAAMVIIEVVAVFLAGRIAI